MSDSATATRTLLTAPATRRKLGNCSDMALWRWLNDEQLDFPRPVVINGRRYFYEDELDRWAEARRESREQK